MADALCGPSNALQSFQKQTSVDRTLQQDRITNPHLQPENFRSGPGPNAAILDAEFEAFQAGQPLEAIYPQEPLFLPNDTPLQSHQQQNDPSDWVSGFKALELNESRASPIPQSQFHHHAPLQHQSRSGWSQDYASQQVQNQQSQHSYQPQLQSRAAHGWSYGLTGGLLPHQGGMLSSRAQQKQPETLVDNDKAAYEEAFEAAAADLNFQQRDTQLDQDIYRSEEAGKTLTSPEKQAWLDHSRVGSDRILDEDEDQVQQVRDQDDADELARTAGQLLANVQDNQSKKFQESNFLSLMRQLHNKEVRVEDDKIVDITQPLHPGGKHYPYEEVNSTSQRREDLLRHQPVELNHQQERLETREHLMARLGLNPQELSNHELFGNMMGEASFVYNTINKSASSLKWQFAGATPPYSLYQLREDVIMEAIKMIRATAEPRTYDHYMWGQREGDPDNWVIRRMLYYASEHRASLDSTRGIAEVWDGPQ